MSEDIDTAWATGVFEGEGCITISGGTPSLHVDMTDEDVIRRVAVIFGGTVTGPTYRADCKPIYHWRCYGVKPVQAVLRRMWPHLGERRRARAAEVIVEYYEAPIWRRRGRGERAAGVLPPRLDTSKHQRYRARKDGLDVPMRRPGPRKRRGYVC
jgi:hypothetical protein